MPAQMPREITAFIASPGDLAPERKAFRDTVDDLNKAWADGAGVKFTALGWEDVLAQTGQRAQEVINLEVTRCDFFVLALNRQWGQAAPDSKYSSYTEEEFQLAHERWEQTGSPKIAVFFKNVDQSSLADPGKDLQKILDFRKKLGDSRRTLYKYFNTEVDFGKEVDRHLRAFAKGDWEKLDQLGPPDVGPISKEKTNALELTQTPNLTLVEAERTALAMARAAVEAANKNHIEDATLLFAKASKETTNLAVLSVAAEFFQKIGDLTSASELIRRQAALAEDRMVAARYYMTLVPKGYAANMTEQVSSSMLSQVPAEIAEEVREIQRVMLEKVEEDIVAMMVKYYSTPEILQLAKHMASPEAQAVMSKSPQLMAEMMESYQREFERIVVQRYPELGAAQAVEATARDLIAGPDAASVD
jgi:hypothetical protein